MRNIKSLYSIIFLIAVWELMARANIIDASFFPRPSIIFQTLYNVSIHGPLLLDLGFSLIRLSIAAIVSIPIAYILATICVHQKLVDQIISPLVALTYPLPKVAIFPLLLIIFGIADASKVVMISIGIFYLVFIHLREGMRSLLKSEYHSIVKIYKLNGFNYYYHFLFKGSWKSFLMGITTGLNYGLTLVVVSEFNLSHNGIGNFIWNAWDQFKIEQMYAGIFLLCLIGFFMNLFFDSVLKKNQSV